MSAPLRKIFGQILYPAKNRHPAKIAASARALLPFINFFTISSLLYDKYRIRTYRVAGAAAHALVFIHCHRMVSFSIYFFSKGKGPFGTCRHTVTACLAFFTVNANHKYYPLLLRRPRWPPDLVSISATQHSGSSWIVGSKISSASSLWNLPVSLDFSNNFATFLRQRSSISPTTASGVASITPKVTV